MTYEKLATKSAASVYGCKSFDGVRIVWSGAIDNIQFDVFRYEPLQCLVFAFAGTNELWDWRRHILVRRERLKGFRGKVHRGWLADWRKVQSTALGAFNEGGRPKDTLILCGHSYGGALANLAGLFFAMKMPADQIKLYTFGCPRVGCKQFASTIDGLIPHHYRYTIKGDPVTHLPLGIRYKHAGMHIQLPYAPNAHSVRNYQEAVI